MIKLSFLEMNKKLNYLLKNILLKIMKMNWPTDLLENLSLEIITLEKFKNYIGKPISELLKQKNINALVVGIERNENRILNPKTSTVLEDNDILYIIVNN